MPLVPLPTSTGASWVWTRRCFQQAGSATEVTLMGNEGQVWWGQNIEVMCFYDYYLMCFIITHK